MTAPAAELPSRADVVVVGLGAAGSAALSFLAHAGVKTVGLDRFAPPHDRGSSHGETRLLRTAYSEGAAYVPMVRRAIALWRDLETRTNASLFRQTGVVYGGPQSSEFLAQAKAAARRWQVDLDICASGTALRLPPDWQCLLDVAGGYLDAEGAIAAFLNDARAHGAATLGDCRCLAIAFGRDGAEVATMRGAIKAGRVVVAGGAWAAELVPVLAPVTHIERRVLHWFDDPTEACRAEAGFRPFLVTTEDDSAFYGFPANGRGRVKVAEHFVQEKIASADALDRNVSQKDIELIQPLVSRFLPALGAHVRAQVCMYPMSRDEHFIVDRHPEESRLVIGSGLSGHGFKFSPVIGEALARLALGMDPEIELDVFVLSRFAEFR